MKVTDKDVSYVAELANLELTEEERKGMLRDLNSILGLYRSAERTRHIASPADGAGFRSLRRRSKRSKEASDLPMPAAKMCSKVCANRCRMMRRCANAPDADEHFFRVPKVIER